MHWYDHSSVDKHVSFPVQIKINNEWASFAVAGALLQISDSGHQRAKR